MSARSPVRRALTWWFRWPANPWVACNFAVDFLAGRTYLASLAGEEGPRVSLNHLVAASIARTLREFPKANGRVIGRKIVLAEHVGIVMPINLVGHGGAENELSMALVTDVDQLTLCALAEVSRARVAAERTGRPTDPVVRALLGLAEHAPGPVFRGALGVFDRALKSPVIGGAFYRKVGVTTGLSNAGAAFSTQSGLLFRGASVAPPQRLFQVGTFWGASAVQDEVIPVDGVPTIRPMLPVIMLFDHRLIDGVMAGRVATRFGEILMHPGEHFGAHGRG